MKPALPVILSGVVMGGCFIGMAVVGDLRLRVPAFLSLHFGAFGVYLLALIWIRFRKGHTHHLVWIVAFGLLFRAALLYSPATLSDDVYRYLWDGRVQSYGVNPYLYPPEAPELESIRDGLHSKINHPEVSTIYPPFSELVFLIVYLIFPGPITFKVLFTLFDLGTAFLLFRLLKRRGVPTEALIVYLWSPLVVVEVAGSAHVDAMAIFWMVGAMLWVEMDKPIRASAALALSILSKPFALALIPVFWGRIRDRRGRLAFLLLPAILAAGTLSYAAAGEGLFAGLRTYAAHWAFNDVLYRYIADVVGSQRVARLGIVVLFGLGAIALGVRRVDPVKAGFILAGAFILLTPTLHPWYVLWMIPFLVFRESPAWLYLTGAVSLSYHVLIRYVGEGIWVEADWVRWIAYGVFGVIIAGEQGWKWKMKNGKWKVQNEGLPHVRI